MRGPICMLQIRQSQNWRLGRVIRLFCNGMEVFDEQLLSELPCQVLHCTVTDGRIGACTCGKGEAAARQRCQGVRYPQLELSSLNDFEASTSLCCKKSLCNCWPEHLPMHVSYTKLYERLVVMLHAGMACRFSRHFGQPAFLLYCIKSYLASCCC